MGDTTVTWTAVDVAGNNGIAIQSVTVTDTTAPVLNLPANITAEASSPTGATVSFVSTATDLVDGGVPVSCTPASGSAFGVGSTTVNCSASDGANNTASGGFNVAVQDTIAPIVTAPIDVSTEATGPQTSVDIGNASAVDTVGVVKLTNDAPAQFSVGTTTVTWTAADAAGNVGTDTQSVSVVDTTAPTFNLQVLVKVLSPPNHKLVRAAVVDNVADAVDPAPVVDITLTSNQATNGQGDGNAEKDWLIEQQGSQWIIFLRSERSGKQGDRIYTINVNVTDSQGNVGNATESIVVLKKKGKGDKDEEDEDHDKDHDKDKKHDKGKDRHKGDKHHKDKKKGKDKD